MTATLLFAAALLAIVLIGGALVGIHDAIARIVERERRHRIHAQTRVTFGRHVPLYVRGRR
jgi:hypothetical protein